MTTSTVPDLPCDIGDPRRDRSLIPYTDADTEALIDQLVDILIILRCPFGLGDVGATVSVLASLEAEVVFRLPDAVADARDQGYTWDEIAMRLANTASAARHRYADYTRSRRELLRAATSIVTSDTRASDVEAAVARRDSPTQPRSNGIADQPGSSQGC